MNWDKIEGRWMQMKGKIRSQWAKLTDDDMKLISGKKDMLVGRIQERYGMKKDEAEREVDRWLGQI